MARSAIISGSVGIEHIVATQADFESSKPFFDDINFPRGFRRCGDFTNKEAALLEQHGHALQSLSEQSRLPISPAESNFIAVIQGQLPASTLLERTWLKYTHLCKGKPFYSVGFNSRFDRGYDKKVNYDPSDFF